VVSIELRIRVDGIGVIQFNRIRQPLISNVQQWIYEVKKQYGYREVVIEKVLADDRDITEEVKGAQNG
jgi:hypothetical protein